MVFPSDEILTDDLHSVECTFDRSVSRGTDGYCVKCTTEARMSGELLHNNSRGTGMCLTRGCRGYTGHPPAGRPQGEDQGGGDQMSDDVPLLFSPLSPTSSTSSLSSREMDMVDHCHGQEPKRDASKVARRQLTLAIILCSIFVLGEVIGGYYSSSLAIMGDAAHMFSDLASFGVSLFVLWLSDKKPKKTMTYGYYRAEALGALATLVIIWYVTGILVYLAIKRIHDTDFEIHSEAMVVVASCAVVFNILLGLTLHGVCQVPHSHSHGGGGHSHGVGHNHSHGDSSSPSSQINIRAAMIHVLGDLLQSFGVLVSSLLIRFFGDSFKIADPICTLIFACIVVATTWTVLRDTLVILLEGTPPSIGYDHVYNDLIQIKEVYRIHSLHIWSLTADIHCLSVHLTTSPGSDQEMIRQEANRILRTKYSIYRTTIQIEIYKAQVMSNCESCKPLER